MFQKIHIDALGALQLAATCAVSVAMWIFVYFSYLARGLHGVIAVLIALALAALTIMLQLHQWRRLGGRAAIVETNRWIRERAVPDSVTREVWYPQLKTRERDAAKQWNLMFVVTIWLVIVALHLLWPSDEDQSQGLWIFIAALYIAMGARVVYYNLRWLPVIRRMLFEAGAKEAAAET